MAQQPDPCCLGILIFFLLDIFLVIPIQIIYYLLSPNRKKPYWQRPPREWDEEDWRMFKSDMWDFTFGPPPEE
jgi:hypothetical protein